MRTPRFWLRCVLIAVGVIELGIWAEQTQVIWGRFAEAAALYAEQEQELRTRACNLNERNSEYLASLKDILELNEQVWNKYADGRTCKIYADFRKCAEAEIRRETLRADREVAELLRQADEAERRKQHFKRRWW